MTITPAARTATILELRAAVQVGDELLESERRARTSSIRKRVTAVGCRFWTMIDRRDSGRGQIEIHRPGTVSYSLIARVLRSGRNPVADADLIAHAPADLAYLLAEVDRLREERDVLLTHATEDGRVAYWQVRSVHRQQEAAARTIARKETR